MNIFFTTLINIIISIRLYFNYINKSILIFLFKVLPDTFFICLLPNYNIIKKKNEIKYLYNIIEVQHIFLIDKHNKNSINITFKYLYLNVIFSNMYIKYIMEYLNNDNSYEMINLYYRIDNIQYNKVINLNTEIDIINNKRLTFGKIKLNNK